MLMFNSQALITNVSSKHLKINRLLPGALCLFITHSSYLNAQLSGCQLTAWGHLEEVLTHGYTYRVVWQIPSATRAEESKLSYKNSFDSFECLRVRRYEKSYLNKTETLQGQHGGAVIITVASQQERPGFGSTGGFHQLEFASLHILLALVWVLSGYHPQSKDMHVRLTGYSKLAVDGSVNGCLPLYVSPTTD